MSDLVERLRRTWLPGDDPWEAADEIERLQGEAVDDAVESANLKAEIERLRELLLAQKERTGEYLNENAKLKAVVDAAQHLVAILRSRTWEDSDMNACGMKAGDSSDVHALRKVEQSIAALEGGDEQKTEET